MTSFPIKMRFSELLSSGNIHGFVESIENSKLMEPVLLQQVDGGSNELVQHELPLWKSAFGLTVLNADDLFIPSTTINEEFTEWKDWESTLAGMSELVKLQKEKEEEGREDRQLLIKQLASLLLIGWYLQLFGKSSDDAATSESLVIYSLFAATENLGKMWESCSNSRNLRIMPASTTTLSGIDRPSHLLPTKLLVELNEGLEIIRLEALKGAGYSSIKALETPSLLEQLSAVLSVSFTTALEFSELSKTMTTLNLDFLSLFSSVLPLSWFSGEFLLTIGAVLTDFHVNSFSDPLSGRALSAALLLLQSHSLLEESDAKPIPGILDDLIRICCLPSLQNKDQELAWKEIAATTVINYTSKDFQMIPLLCSLLESIVDFTITVKLSQSFAILSSKIPLDDFPAVSRALLANPVWNDNRQSLLSIMRVFFYVSDYHCKSFKSTGSFCWTRNPVPEFSTLLFSALCLDSSSELIASEACYFAFYGIIRAFQVRASAHLPSSKRILTAWEKDFLRGVQVVQIPHLPYLVSEFSTYKSEPITKYDIEESKLISLYERCFEGIIDSEAFLYCSELHLLSQVKTESDESLILKSLESKMTREGELFSSLGKIAKTISHGLSLFFDIGLFDKLKRLFKRLDTFTLTLASFCDCEFFDRPIIDAEKEISDSLSLQSRLLKYLKVALYTVFILMEPLPVFLQSSLLQEDRIPFKQHSIMISLIDLSLSIYSNLHAFTSLFKLRHLEIYDKQITIMVASLVKMSIINPSLRQAHVDIIGSFYYLGSNIAESLRQVSRTNFYLLLTSKMVDFIGSAHLESKLLVVVNQNLVSRPEANGTSPAAAVISDSGDLSHFVWQKIFESSILHQGTIRNYGQEYARTLIQNIHHGIELKLAKEQFSNIIRGLCDLSPAKEHPLVTARLDSFDSNDHVVADSLNGLIPIISLNERDEWAKEALELAWSLVMDLFSLIHSPSTHSLESSLTPVLLKDVIGNGALSREIIRISLATILISQIPFIALSKLDAFLEIVEVTLLGHHQKPFGSVSLSSSTADSTSVVMGSSDSLFEGIKLSSPLGIVRDVDASLVWKTVFDAVSDPTLIDYGRRYRCIEWYTRIYNDAKKKGLYAEASPPVFPIKAKL